MKAIVIGSGLGGLECALELARHGHEVTVLEKGRQAGGCLQTFSREGYRFDTGFHYVGGLAPGEPLHRIFDHFGLLDLPWKQINPTCAEEIIIGEERFRLPSGIDAYITALSEQFPTDRAGLKDYGDLLRQVGDHIFDAFDGGQNPLLGISAADYLQRHFSDPVLRKVLSGSTMRLHQDAATLPLYIFAQINGSFIRSAWKLPGGGKVLVDRLVRDIKALGGNVRTGTEVTGLRLADGKVTAVEVNGDSGNCNGETLYADTIVSDAHPAATMALLRDKGTVKEIYRRRICALKNSPGVFTANILLKEGALQLPEGQLYVHTAEADLWHPDPSRTESVLIHTYPDAPDRLDLLSLMPLPERNASYEASKRAKLEECLALAERGIPGLRDAVSRVWTSTPRTYLDYTGIPGGSAFGVIKDWKSPLTTLISPRTGASNLFLTGASLNLHGLLGVSMTALMTCQAILGTANPI